MASKKLKDWFDSDLAVRLASDIETHHPPFDGDSFAHEVSSQLAPLEMKARIALFAEMLREYLPEDYREAIAVIRRCLGEENPNETGMFTDYFWVMPYAFFVERYGLDDPEISLDAIEDITRRNTGEFAVRPFLDRHLEQTFERMLAWSRDDSFHLRRLASEGTRPRLPWAKKFDAVVDDPSLTAPILDTLKDDPIRFVQRSVANHVNDHFRDNAEFAMSLLESWQSDAGGARRWIIRHALRTERKKGNPAAEALTAAMAAR